MRSAKESLYYSNGRPERERQRAVHFCTVAVDSAAELGKTEATVEIAVKSDREYCVQLLQSLGYQTEDTGNGIIINWGN